MEIYTFLQAPKTLFSSTIPFEKLNVAITQSYNKNLHREEDWHLLSILDYWKTSD